MPKGLTDPKHYQDIADAIRGRNGFDSKYTPAQMAGAISAIDTTASMTDADELYWPGGMDLIESLKTIMKTDSQHYDNIAKAINKLHKTNKAYKPEEMAAAIYPRYDVDDWIGGVSWAKGSSSAMTRTGDAADFASPSPAVGTGSGSSPFDDVYPWSEIERVTIDGNELVKIPKFYFKVEDGTTWNLTISKYEMDGFTVSPMHSDRGDGKGERDYAYVSRYTLNSSYKSTSGNASKVSITRATARSGISALGSNYCQYDYLTLCTIWMLYLVEFADWNSQAKIGRGYCDSNSAQINTGGTDSMTYHTGRASGTDGKTAVQYRWMENLWGNIFQWVDGIYFSGSNIYFIANPSSFSDSSGGVKLSYSRTTVSSGYISAMGHDPSHPGLIYPTAASGGDTTYVTDYEYYDGSGVVLDVGGYWYSGSPAGLLSCNGYNAASVSASGIGARLIYLP